MADASLAERVAALEANHGAMGREIGQLRTDIKDGFSGVKERQDDQSDEQKQSRRAMLGLAISIAGSSVMVMIGLILAFGGGA